MLFTQLGLIDPLANAVAAEGYVEPTPIQAKAIPYVLAGKDLLGLAQTGTGKTAAFALPILQRLATASPRAQRARPIRCLVLTPTRELAAQIGESFTTYGKHLPLRNAVIFGGVGMDAQKRALREGMDILVATPGRLLDLVGQKLVDFSPLEVFVLDEADRMLDMGFINDVDAILKKVPLSRQTMLFSATFPEEIRNLADRYMLHPETVRMHAGTRVTRQVEHELYPVASRQKFDLLVALLGALATTKTLIFCATREGTSELASQLRRRRREVLSLSSLLSQANRERALEAFRNGDIPILVATDVAARGLDITDIDLVVNYDVPMSGEEYVHRIGRTGRAAALGRAVTLATELDGRRVSDIERKLGDRITVRRLDGFAYETMPEVRRASGNRGARRRGPSRPPRRSR